MTHTIVAMREPVTIARAAEVTGVRAKVIRRLIDRGKLQPRACLVDGRHTQLFELWEVQAALANRDPRRVVHPMTTTWG